MKSLLLAFLFLSTTVYAKDISCEAKKLQGAEVKSEHFIKAKVLTAPVMENIVTAFKYVQDSEPVKWKIIQQGKSILANMRFDSKKFQDFYSFEVNIMEADGAASSLLIPKSVMQMEKFKAYTLANSGEVLEFSCTSL
jgi:hypothetical protein